MKKKRPCDLNQLATSIVAEATEAKPAEEPANPIHAAAVVLGRLGGLKGGKARAKKLSAKRRMEIAKQAAMKRWGSSRKPSKDN